MFFDAEHFFDGYRENPEFSMRVLEEAAMAGADCLVLCDTNGGSLPGDVERIVRQVADHLQAPVGVHLHNDTGCGVANALAGVAAGATQVQGPINGYGERVATYTPDIRYDKIMEAFGGHCENVTEPSDIKAALERAFQATKEGKTACVTVISEHMETAPPRDGRAGSLIVSRTRIVHGPRVTTTR